MKQFNKILAILLLAVIFGGCNYDFMLPDEIIDPGDPSVEDISFSQEIIPIFKGKCTGCHQPGGQQPYLTEDEAYNSLNSPRYVNVSTPESSLIYTKPSPEASGSHPKYSAGEASKVLVWITQGAKNN